MGSRESSLYGERQLGRPGWMDELAVPAVHVCVRTGVKLCAEMSSDTSRLGGLCTEQPCMRDYHVTGGPLYRTSMHA